jgi:hypothetical protein
MQPERDSLNVQDTFNIISHLRPGSQAICALLDLQHNFERLQKRTESVVLVIRVRKIQS